MCLAMFTRQYLQADINVLVIFSLIHKVSTLVGTQDQQYLKSQDYNMFLQSTKKDENFQKATTQDISHIFYLY